MSKVSVMQSDIHDLEDAIGKMSCRLIEVESKLSALEKEVADAQQFYPGSMTVRLTIREVLQALITKLGYSYNEEPRHAVFNERSRDDGKAE